MALTLNPMEVVRFDRSDAELEDFWLFCLLVAGKNSDWAAGKVEAMRELCRPGQSVLRFLARENVRERLMDFRTGQYKRLTGALWGTFNLGLNRLRTASVSRLEEIYGVGPKTARMFVAFSRPSVSHAILDTHLLRWVALRRPDVKVPKQTPQSPRVYAKLEALVLEELKKEYPGLTPAEADLRVWTLQSGRAS